MVHDGVQAADVSEDDGEKRMRGDSLHEADEVLGERDALEAAVMLYGADGFPGDGLRLQHLEDGTDAVEHACIDEIRGDGGDLDGALLPFQLNVQAFAPAYGAPLGGGVQGHPWQGKHTGGRCYVADVANSAGAHIVKETEGDVHGALGVDVYGAVYVAVRLLSEELVVGDDAGVIDEDVHRGTFRLGCRGGLVYGLGTGNIGLEACHLAFFRQFLDGGLNGLVVDIPDDYLRSAFFQADICHELANSGASSGDKNGFSLNLHC